MDLARAPRRNARKKGSGYENVTEREVCTEKYQTEVFFVQTEPVYRAKFVQKDRGPIFLCTKRGG